MIPTVAEVREALAIAGLAFGVREKHNTAAAMNALLARLDPDTQVIVDWDTLTAAIYRGQVDVRAYYPDPHGDWLTPEQAADLIIEALRAPVPHG
jgi:hypothetical protein